MQRVPGFGCAVRARHGMLAVPDARSGELPGQAHEAMTTAPETYAAAVSRSFLP